MDRIRSSWNHRSIVFGNSTKSVMEQSFPDALNAYLTRQNLQEILMVLPPGRITCLDVGSGWGRIAQELVKKRDNITIMGIDGSSRFVEEFNKKLKSRGKAKVGDMRHMPYKNSSFEFLYCVASLMYQESYADQLRTVKEMFRVLKPQGKIILIEPHTEGVKLVRFGGLIPFIYRVILKKPKTETYGITFSLERIRKLVKAAGGRVIFSKGYPLFTLTLLPNIVIGKIVPSLLAPILRIIQVFDDIVQIPHFSYYVTWVISK